MLKLYINLPRLSNSIRKIVRKEWVFVAVTCRGIPTKGMPLCNNKAISQCMNNVILLQDQYTMHIIIHTYRMSYGLELGKRMILIFTQRKNPSYYFIHTQCYYQACMGTVVEKAPEMAVALLNDSYTVHHSQGLPHLHATIIPPCNIDRE